MKKLAYSVIALISLSFQAQAQDKFGQLREKYELFANNDIADSALIYAHKSKVAAIREFGLFSPNYLRSTNSLGYWYLNYGKKKEDIDSAKYWLVYTNDQLKKAKGKSYDKVENGVLLNLFDLYCLKMGRLDSASYFLDRYIANQSKLNIQEQINSIAPQVADFESVFGLNAADLYYKKILALKEVHYGKWSAALTRGLDSLLRSHAITNNPSRRLILYKTMDEPLSLNELREAIADTSISKSSEEYLLQLAALVDETVKTKGDKSLMLIEALQTMGKYYWEWLGEKEFAIFYYNHAIHLAQSIGKENTDLFAKLKNELKLILEEKPIELSLAKTVIFDASITKADPINKAPLRLMLPIGHPQGITLANISPNGRFVYSKSFNDINLKIWDVQTGALIYNLPSSATPNFGLFTADSRSILVVSGKQCVLWDLKDGIKKWEKHLSFDVSYGLLMNKGAHLLIGDQENNVLVFELITGKLLAQFQLKKEVIYLEKQNENNVLLQLKEDKNLTSLFILDYLKGILKPIIKNKPFSINIAKEAFSLTFQDRVTLFDLQTLQLKSFFEVDSGANIQALSSDGRKILLSYNADSARLIYNTNDGKPVSTRYFGYIAQNYAFLNNTDQYLTHDGADAALWDGFSGKIIGVLETDTTARIRRTITPFIRFSEDGKFVLMAFSDNVLRLWDVSGDKPSLVRAFSGKTSALYVSAISDDKRYFATKDNADYIRIMDLEANKLIGTIEHQTMAEAGIIFDHQHKKIITNSDSSIRIWDFPSLQLRKEIKYDGIWAMDISRDNTKLVTSSFPKKEIRTWDLNNYSYEVMPFDSVGSTKYNANGDKWLVSKKMNGFKIIDPKTKEEHLSVNIPEWDYSTQYSNQDRFILHITNIAVWVYDAQIGKLINRFEIDNDVNTTGILMSPDGKLLLIGAHSGKLLIYDLYTKEKIKEIAAHTAGFDLQTFDNDKKLLTCSNDGTIKVWDFKTFEPIYEMVPFDDSDYVIYTPSGYYTASPQATRNLHYVTSDLNVVGFDQLDVKYNRPDKVFAQIGGTDQKMIDLYAKAYQKRIKKLGVDTTSFKEGFALPEAEIMGRASIALEQTSRYLTLKISGKDPNRQLHHFNIWINEIPLFGMKGVSITGNRKQIDTTITIPLSQGKNSIETSVSNIAGIESYRKPLIVNYLPKEPTKEQVWYVGIGIGDFKDKSQNLKWSTTDIINLNRELKIKYKTDYHSIQLLDKSVTKENVLALKKFLQDSTKIDDKVILSFSGHGLMSKNFDYFLSSYATDFNRPEKEGISYELLESLLDSIPARKKLLLLDACYSGEVDKEEMKNYGEAKEKLGQKGVSVINYNKNKKGTQNPFQLMQQMFDNVSRNTGAIIVSASAGNQFALEKNDLKSGIFTYSILEMLKNCSTIKISAFKKKIVKRVAEISEGLQVPTIRGDHKAYDWELW